MKFKFATRNRAENCKKIHVYRDVTFYSIIKCRVTIQASWIRFQLIDLPKKARVGGVAISLQENI
jgi:hypothetical protein